MALIAQGLVIALILAVLLSQTRRHTKPVLRPFEYDETGLKEPELDNNTSLTTAKSLVLVIVVFTVSPLLYFLLNFLVNSNGMEYYEYDKLQRQLSIITGAISNLVLLAVVFPLRQLRIKPVLVLLILANIAVYLFFNFFQGR